MAIAYSSTWTTYGTRLPGDERGWFRSGAGWQAPDRLRALEAALLMTEDALTLDPGQRRLVEKVIAEHCAIRGWLLHAVNCRSNHVHVVVTAPDRPVEVPREQFKAWTTRRLKELDRARRAGAGDTFRNNWWTERGCDEYLDDDDELADVNCYVLEAQ